MNIRSAILGICLTFMITPRTSFTMEQCSTSGTPELIGIGARVAFIGLITYLARPSAQKDDGSLRKFIVPMVAYAMSKPLLEDLSCLYS